MKSTDKKVKTVDEAVKEVVEGKKQNIELQVFDYPPPDEMDPFKEQGIRGFKTLVKHEDIAGYSVNDKFVAIMDKQGATFVYRMDNFNRIFHYSV